MKESQAKQLLAFFLEGGKIMIMEAFKRFGITSLHRRLSDLNEQGVVIQDRWIDLPSGKRVKKYWIEKTNKDD